MSNKVSFINRAVYVIMFLWTSLMLGIAFIIINDNYNYANILAKNEAIVSVKKDLAYRSWVASHGGVYVPITKKTPPNPYLSHIQNRDINTSANQKLTLMNPAYTLSQIMRDYSELYGTKGHITSLILMNPVNKPDTWEEKALKEADISGNSSSKKEFINGEEYFRYLKPLVTQESCLKCHAFQGYKIGDIRGGVSVSIPMKAYYEEAFSQSKIHLIITILVYLLGVSVVVYGKKIAKEMLENKIKNYEQHIFSLVSIIEKRDSYTAGHTQRVARYAVLIAKEMGYKKDDIDNIYRACMLHDIGKISTPDSILLKPGKLTS
jgi:HD-GYP domain-containing protein (c-di-GMP phosphodiesterase class II)